MQKRLRTAVLMAAGLVLAASAFAHEETGHCERADGLGKDARRELARARLATAHYHNLQRALGDGYVDIDVFVPGMGFHYLKPDLLDDQFEPERPELLVYSPDEHGRMRLVAAEYAVPLALTAEPPAGFSGDADVWDPNEQFGIWTLHAWRWRFNPSGIFSPLNPRVP